MSKVQEKDATLLNNLSGAEIANELDSRLRDLEKNIAVAREFIKLADESYSELRHKWNLLSEDVRNKPQARITQEAPIQHEKAESRTRNKEHSKTRQKVVTVSDEPKTPNSADTSVKLEGHVHRNKSTNQHKKETETSGEDTTSPGSDKHFQPYRDRGRRRGKTNGRN
jgi:predicted nuclease with TOPRIM domain